MLTETYPSELAQALAKQDDMEATFSSLVHNNKVLELNSLEIANEFKQMIEEEMAEETVAEQFAKLKLTSETLTDSPATTSSIHTKKRQVEQATRSAGAMSPKLGSKTIRKADKTLQR
jgi:hypothetical protein